MGVMSSVLGSPSGVFSGAASVVSGFSPILVIVVGLIVAAFVISTVLSMASRSGTASGGVGAGAGRAGRGRSSLSSGGRGSSGRARRGSSRGAALSRTKSGRVVISDTVAAVLNDPATVRTPVDYGRPQKIADAGSGVGTNDMSGHAPEGLFG